MSTTPGEPTAEKIYSIQDIISGIEIAIHAATGQHIFRDGRDGSFTPAAGLLAQQIKALVSSKPEELTPEERQAGLKLVTSAIVGYSENEMFHHISEEDAHNMAHLIMNLF